MRIPLLLQSISVKFLISKNNAYFLKSVCISQYNVELLNVNMGECAQVSVPTPRKSEENYVTISLTHKPCVSYLCEYPAISDT